MGCDPIILIGQDLAFTEDKTHAAGQDTWSFKSLPEETVVAIRDVWGREVKTITQFLGFAQVFEIEASTNRRGSSTPQKAEYPSRVTSRCGSKTP